MKKKITFLFILYLVVLIGLLIYPSQDTGIILPIDIFGIPSDKLIHAILFIPFLIFCRKIVDKKQFLVSLMFGISFASFCESIHFFLPYREFSVYDFYANLVGIGIGSFSYFTYPKIN